MPRASAVIPCSTIAVLAGSAAAQGYPDRPARIVVPFSARGTSDVVARGAGMELQRALRQPRKWSRPVKFAGAKTD